MKHNTKHGLTRTQHCLFLNRVQCRTIFLQEYLMQFYRQYGRNAWRCNGYGKKIMGPLATRVHENRNLDAKRNWQTSSQPCLPISCHTDGETEAKIFECAYKLGQTATARHAGNAFIQTGEGENGISKQPRVMCVQQIGLYVYTQPHTFQRAQ